MRYFVQSMKQKCRITQSLRSFCLAILLILQTMTFTAAANAESALGYSGTAEVSESGTPEATEPSEPEKAHKSDINYGGNKPNSIFGENNRLEDSQPTPVYTITKKATSNSTENGFMNQTSYTEGAIEWQVDIAAKDTFDDSILLSLEGLKFYDALDLTEAGPYVEGSFKVNGQAATPEGSTANALTYTFPPGIGSKATVTFKTWIPKEKYYREYNPGDAGWQTIANAAELRDSSGQKLDFSNSWRVALKSDWIQHVGTLNKPVNPTDPSTITWTIDVNKNYNKQGLKSFTITDALPGGLAFKSAAYQLWDNGTNDWSATKTPITPDAGSVYALGDVNGPIRLVIVSEVIASTSYTNKAIAQWKLDGNPVQDNDQATVWATYTIHSPPTITGHPSSAVIAAGGTATFSVTASNATGYQWQVDEGSGFMNISNGAPYSGATWSTLTITGATAEMSGYVYRVIARGLALPEATSNGATLTVTANSPPTITGHPSSASIAAGGTTTFSVTASDATGYQWQVDAGTGFTNISNGAPYSGATTSTLTITGATAGMSGYVYRVIARGLALPDATSNGATLTVNSPPTITGHPSSASIAAGGTTTFSVTASDATGYQWQVDAGTGFTNISNGAPYSGATTSTLTITGATAGMSGYVYRVIAKGSALPDATSNGATLTVNSPPSAAPAYIASSNAELKSLTLSNGEGETLTLSPAYRADVLTYEANTDASQIVIGTVTDHWAAKTTYRLNGQAVPADLKANLNVGKNELLIQVQAENGATRIYTVNITRNSEETTYNDTKGHWAEQQIRQAARMKIVNGYEDGSFAPDKSVMRAEFLVMLMNALKPQTDGAELAFSDASSIGAWAHNAVAQALQAGIVTGYEDGTFRPNGEIKRSEMAVMIARSLGLSENENTGGIDFADERDIPPWARGAVAALKQLGLVSGKGANVFDPTGLLTRAEAVTVILNMLTQQSK
ncbi:cadherin-like protein [Cohnella sp. SGD-V74]|uniref:S-layer homology domain-containing protein n=1 Tax=unclassified Cohnella TaxID=2636738 RepID=UPI000D43CFDF|nr:MULTISPECIES: S-layer homology domain-containing protein [unclassified Cohnella]PRX74865.1 cadherin-like protein [Cohnella sp. SGD-V74]